MARDERLLPLPTTGNLQRPVQDVPTTYSPVYDGDSFAEKRSFQEYLNIVFKRKWMILAIVTVITLCVAIYMYRQPSVYASQATVLIETRQTKKANESVSINLWYDTKYWDTQVKLIQNPELMRDAVISLGLHRNPNLFAEQNNQTSFFTAVTNMVSGVKPQTGKTQLLPNLNSDSGLSSDKIQLTEEESKRADEYARSLVGGLSVAQQEKTNLVDIKYQTTNPELAVAIPNAIAKVFIANDTRREMEGVLQQTEENARQIQDLQANINRLENERINYLQAADLPLREKGQDLVAERLTARSTNWLAAEKDRQDLQGKYEAALRAREKGDIYAIPGLDQNLAIQKARELNRIRTTDLEKRIEEYDKLVSELETKKAEMLVKYTEEYPAVKSINEQIKAVQLAKDKTQRENSQKIEQDKQKLAKEAETEVLTGLRAQLDSAIKREAQSRAAYFQEREAANSQGQSEVKLTSLTQEIETNRKLLDSALQQQKTLELQATNQRPNNIKITSRAEGAGIVGPNRQRNIWIAFFISLASGIGLAFLLDYLDDSIKSSDDIGRYLGLPTLALIPHQIAFERSIVRGRLAGVNGNGGTGAETTALAVLDDSRSALAEAYRHLRTSLLFSSAGKPPQTILVTSSQPSEGKTTTAINTAVTLAQSGADVVIVDCDLRRPRLHQHFQLDNAHGLTNFLSGERNTRELIKECDKLPNLKIVTSGPIPPNPAELLSSTEMRNFIEFLRTNFKHVIIDSPPAISFTDATILSTLVDGVVIVAMAGKSSIHLMRRLKQRLSGIGARVYGVVLNGLKRNSLDYGYYGYGYNYYSYYSEDEQEADVNVSVK